MHEVTETGCYVCKGHIEQPVKGQRDALGQPSKNGTAAPMTMNPETEQLPIFKGRTLWRPLVSSAQIGLAADFFPTIKS